MNFFVPLLVTDEGFVANNARSRSSFAFWLTALKQVDWNTPGDIQHTFGSADLLGNGTNRVVFDIGGNTYRMICKYAFGAREAHLFICWIGIHAQYDQLCDGNLQYTVNLY